MTIGNTQGRPRTRAGRAFRGTTMVAVAAAFFITAAEAATPLPAGVWKGTIGGAPVMLCLPESGHAEYYYLRHKRGLRLTVPGPAARDHDAMAKAWQSGALDLEEQPAAIGGQGVVTGRWRLASRSATELAGTWTDAKGGRTAPIALTRVAASAKPDARTPGGSCATPFYEPLRAAMRVQATPAKFEGREYRELASDQGTSVELPATVPNAERVNRWALDWLRLQAVGAYECNTNKGAVGEPLAAWLKPVVWTDQFLVLEDGLPDTYCGGAHGNASLAYVTWSLAEGRRLDTAAWLRGGDKALGRVLDRDGEPVRGGLTQLIEREHPRNRKGDDCSDAMSGMSIHAPYPTARGLTFHTGFPHVSRACDDDVALTWKQVAPHLSAQGRAVMESFTGHR